MELTDSSASLCQRDGFMEELFKNDGGRAIINVVAPLGDLHLREALVDSKDP